MFVIVHGMFHWCVPCFHHFLWYFCIFVLSILEIVLWFSLESWPFSIVFPWFSHDFWPFSMVFPWFSYEFWPFSMAFPTPPNGACPGPPRSSRRSRCDQLVEVKVTRQRWAPGSHHWWYEAIDMNDLYYFWYELLLIYYWSMIISISISIEYPIIYDY